MSGLVYAHSKNVIHRNLKTSNVFLFERMGNGNEKDLSLKIGDFGLSEKMIESYLKSFVDCNSHNYMSPQLVTGQAYTSKTDVW